MVDCPHVCLIEFQLDHWHWLQAQQDPCVAYVIQLEQWIMEGAYNQVLAARESAPSVAYQYFMHRLASTVRWAPCQIICVYSLYALVSSLHHTVIRKLLQTASRTRAPDVAPE